MKKYGVDRMDLLAKSRPITFCSPLNLEKIIPNLLYIQFQTDQQIQLRMATQEKKVEKKVDVVSQDRNWVLRINGEMQAQKLWDQQWGYLSKGFSPERTNIEPTITDKIQQLQKEVGKIDDRLYQTANKVYGQGQKVEMFNNSKYNIHENKDLRVMERRLPKGWKKQKWTPPVDPFDPLSNMNKKKK